MPGPRRAARTSTLAWAGSASSSAVTASSPARMFFTARGRAPVVPRAKPRLARPARRPATARYVFATGLYLSRWRWPTIRRTASATIGRRRLLQALADRERVGALLGVAAGGVAPDRLAADLAPHLHPVVRAHAALVLEGERPPVGSVSSFTLVGE